MAEPGDKIYQEGFLSIENARKSIELPVWVWHRDKDCVIKPSRSRDMIEAIKKAGGNPKYSDIKGRGHNFWTDAWNSKEMWEWLYSQIRK